VSIDQYVSSIPGRLPHTKGKESPKDKFNGGTIFVDHASAYIHLTHQVSLHVGEMLRAKHSFKFFWPLMAFALKAFELIMLHLEQMILLLILSQKVRPSIILALVPTTKMVLQSLQFKLLRVGPIPCFCVVLSIGLSR
jgi:hypothetical protein